MLKRLSARKKNPSGRIFRKGAMLMKAKLSIEIPFTFSRKKKYALVQICFLTGDGVGAQKEHVQ